MRKITLASAIVVLLAIPQVGSAITLESVAGRADCDGWSADLSIVVRPGAFLGRLEYAVVLQDADGLEVERFDLGEMINLPGTSAFTMTVSGGWNAPLAGDYTVAGEFLVYDIFGDGYNLSTGSFALDPGCGDASSGDEPARDLCTYTARHWFENPDLWPVTSLEIGGRTIDQAELMSILELRRNSFLMFSLMREMIAAKLNLANGASDVVVADLADADAFLVNLGDAQRRGRNQGPAMRLRAALHRYNRAGCPDGTGGTLVGLDSGFEKDLAGGDKAAVESMSLGAVKALYH